MIIYDISSLGNLKIYKNQVSVVSFLDAKTCMKLGVYQGSNSLGKVIVSKMGSWRIGPLTVGTVAQNIKMWVCLRTSNGAYHEDDGDGNEDDDNGAACLSLISG